MICHACTQPMPLDDYGHPVHDGPCPGYPPRQPRPTVECEHCGHELDRGTLAAHARRCTADQPTPPRIKRVERCRHCQLRHTPRCQAPTWPLAPLLALLPLSAEDAGGRVLKAGGKAHAAILRVDPMQLARWATSGLTDALADRLAVTAGFHPSMVWPDWFDAGLSVVDERFTTGNGWRSRWLHTEFTPEKEQAA